MSRPPVIPPDEKTKIILALLSGQATVTEAAELANVSEQAIRNWKRQFVEGGARNMRGDSVCGHVLKEVELSREIADLKAAIADLYMQLKCHRTRPRTLPESRRVNGLV
ncbi:transposase [Streptomyces sp. NPDC002550]